MILNILLTTLISAALAGPVATKKKAVKLTPAEQKIVAEAELEFKKAKKLPPPSEHMQKKMQSSVSDEPEKK